MASTFIKPLIITDNGDFTFTLMEGFEYHLGDVDSNIVVKVPVGYVTDFASVPRIFWSIIPPYGPCGKAAVIHDYLYNRVSEDKFDRGIADAIFKEALGVLGVGGWKKWAMYFAVRLFGGLAIKFGKRPAKKS